MKSSLKNIAILSVSFLLLSCQSLSNRKPASEEKSGNSLSGTRINPVRFKQEIYTSINLHDGSKNNWEVGKLKLVRYDISNPNEFEALQNKLLAIRQENEVQKKEKGTKTGFLPKSASVALEEALSLLAVFADVKNSNRDRMDSAIHLAEVIASFNYNFQYPIKDQVWILALPFRILNELENPMMTDKAPTASNLNPSESGKPVSQQNPVDSTFWKKPETISQKNLYYGFNRTEIPRFETPCTYEAPKESYGVHGGFTLMCDGKKWKFKFGNETKTEPFNSRLVWALGYNATPVDYVKEGTRVAFDPRVYTEYNSRKDLSIKIKSILGFLYFKQSLQVKLNPFQDAILGAELQDGKFVPAAELEKKVAILEKDIRFLILREGSVESDLENEKSVGPWGWEDFDHKNRRELRAFGIVAAFLNLFDLRNDNNKIRLRETADGSKELVHYVSDLGSGLGNAKGILHNENGAFNEFPWQFITQQSPMAPPSPTQKGGPPERRSPFQILGYNLIQENKTFRRIQLDDARWAARLLTQFSEEQLTDALIAAGMEASEVKLVLEKLVSRRKSLLKALDLENEFSEIMKRPVDKKLSYDPRKEPIPVAKGSRDAAKAPLGDSQILKGKLKPF